MKKLIGMVFAASLLGVAAVGSAAAQAPRPVVVAQSFLTDSLDPANGAAGWALQSHGVAETLFTVDRQGRTVPNLAEAVTRDGEAWRVRLAPGLRFADGSVLDAAAVKAALDRSIEKNPRARSQTGALTISVLGAQELRLVPERPIAAMDGVLAEFPLVIYRADGEGFVFSGPYRVSEFKRGELIRLEPNTHHRSGAGRPPVVIRRISDPQSLALGLESGEFDIGFNLATETLPRLKRRDGLSVVSVPVAYQYMLLVNAAKPPLDDVRVRRALDLAVDRSALVTTLGAGEAASGLFPRFMPWSLSSARAFDRVKAEQLLDEAGWLRPRAGAPRERAGQVLELTLTSYPQRADFVTLSPVLRAQFEAVGIRIKTESVDSITPYLQQKRFDIAFWTMHTAPGGDGAFALEQYAHSRAPVNVMGYASAKVDGLIERLREVEVVDARVAAIRAIQEELVADAPMVFLMTPVWHTGLSARIQGYTPFPSDYYIVRADLQAKP